jgi:anti-sigma factor RsiW
MRSTISDQDLTDYALNEMAPSRRIYVEGILGTSGECRADVYATIDLALSLEEGFERESRVEVEGLRPEQRLALFVINRTGAGRKLAAAFAAAAAVALAVSYPTLSQLNGGAQKVARVSTQMSTYVADAVRTEEHSDLVAQLSNWTQLAEDPVLRKWFSSEWFSHENGMQSNSFESMP